MPKFLLLYTFNILNMQLVLITVNNIRSIMTLNILTVLTTNISHILQIKIASQHSRKKIVGTTPPGYVLSYVTLCVKECVYCRLDIINSLNLKRQHVS